MLPFLSGSTVLTDADRPLDNRTRQGVFTPPVPQVMSKEMRRWEVGFGNRANNGPASVDRREASDIKEGRDGQLGNPCSRATAGPRSHSRVLLGGWSCLLLGAFALQKPWTQPEQKTARTGGCSWPCLPHLNFPIPSVSPPEALCPFRYLLANRRSWSAGCCCVQRRIAGSEWACQACWEEAALVGVWASICIA